MRNRSSHPVVTGAWGERGHQAAGDAQDLKLRSKSSPACSHVVSGVVSLVALPACMVLDAKGMQRTPKNKPRPLATWLDSFHPSGTDSIPVRSTRYDESGRSIAHSLKLTKARPKCQINPSAKDRSETHAKWSQCRNEGGGVVTPWPYCCRQPLKIDWAHSLKLQYPRPSFNTDSRTL